MSSSAMVRSSLVGMFVLLAASLSFAQSNNFQPVYNPTIKIESAAGPIEVDGEFNDPGWQGAARADHFVETSPEDQIRPDVRSEAMITYDAHNLYVGFIAYDDPGQVRVSLRDRDQIWRDDYFGIMLDTYGDASWGYEIFVNPIGVQGDLRMLSDGAEEMSFDLVWYSEGKVTDSGYQVEIAIPFASLRFPDREEQHWRVNFWRDRQRDVRYRYSWSAQDRDESCFLCQLGYLEGISGISPSTNLEILPTAVAFQSGERIVNADSSLVFDNDDGDAELSANVRYGLSSTSSVEGTFNPDFSQVESDAAQIDVNTTFGLYFPERRPFFQEGSNLYQTWINQVYTRTIFDPEIAGKFTGQFGNTQIGYLVARDENSSWLIPSSEFTARARTNKSWINIGRVYHSLGNGSHIGGTVTDRRISSFVDQNSGVAFDDGSGSTYGFDSRIRLSQKYQVEVQVVGSHVREPNPEGAEPLDNVQTLAFDGETVNGYAGLYSFERHGETWNINADYYEYSPRFRAPNGFIRRNDNRLFDFWTGLFFRPNGKVLVNWEPSISFGRIWDFNRFIDVNPFQFRGGTKDEWLRPGLFFEFKGQTTFRISQLISRERFADQLFEGIFITNVNTSTRFTELFSVGLFGSYGKGIFRSRSNPELAIQTNIGMEAEVKPLQQLILEPSLEYARMDRRDEVLAENDTLSENIFEGYIFRNRLSYQFSRELFLRLVVQYDDFNEQFLFEPLLTYKVNPYTVAFVGMTSQYAELPDHTSDPTQDWKLDNRRFFAKLQYLFRL